MVNTKIKITQEELTEKTIRRIFNRGKRKGYVSPAYIEKTVKEKISLVSLDRRTFRHLQN